MSGKNAPTPRKNDRERSRNDDSEGIEPERPRTPREREGVDPSQVDDPPKAEGNRDESES